jgi:hypothetical protein
MPAHGAICAGPLAAAMMPAHTLGRGPFVVARHACACPPSGPLTAGIWGLRSASASALGCNASGFAVVAPSATPASSRPGQQLPQWGKAGRLRLAVLPRLQPRSRQRQRKHHHECDNDDTTRMAGTMPTTATTTTATMTTRPQSQPQQELQDNDGHDNTARTVWFPARLHPLLLPLMTKNAHSRPLVNASTSSPR